MLISTRGRYALRVLLDLAEHQDDGYIAMKNVGHTARFIKQELEGLAK